MSLRLPSLAELRDSQAELQRFRARVAVVQVFVLVCFLLLVARLSYLQIVRHEDLHEQAESNRTAVIPTVPPRGTILDRNGVVLASNYSAYTLEITPSQVPDLEATIDALAEVVEIQGKDRRRFKRLREDARSFDSLPIRTRLSDEEVARFSAQRYRFPGVDIKARLFRQYPMANWPVMWSATSAASMPKKKSASKKKTMQAITGAPNTSANWAWSNATSASCMASRG